MKRRQFIKGAGYLGLLALLKACRLPDFLGRGPDSSGAQLATSIPTRSPTNLPTFTPTVTDTPLPTLGPESPTPTGTSTGTPSPTSSPPNPTATPSPRYTPTITPTPQPTPYPPGPPSKLGLFLTRYEARVLDMVNTAKPALIKTLEVDRNYAKGLKDASPTSIIVGRIFLNQLNLDVDPQPFVQEYINQILPLATDPIRMDAFDGWEAHNEPLVDTPDKMKRLADFEAERIRILAENGIRSVAGNFGVGHPDLPLWPHFKPALDAIRQYGGYLGLHEYSAPVMQYRAGALQPPGDPPQGDEGWLTLRYRKAYRQQLAAMGYGDIPLLITECGVDGLVWPRPGPAEARGWQDFIETWLQNGLRNDPPGVYMDQLIWYDQHLQQDPYVKGAAIFLAGANDAQWESYDILGPGAGHMLDLLTQYLEVHPPA